MEEKKKLYQKWWVWICIVLVVCIVVGVVYFINNQSTSNTKMTAEEIADKLKESGLDIGEIVTYTEETDINNLLGRPNQYITKATFAINSIEQPEKVTKEDLKNNGWSKNEIQEQLILQNEPRGGTIETFNNKSDMQKRKDYIETLSSSASIFAQYIYSNDYVLLRLETDLTPEQAKKYETAFNEIMNQ